MLTIPSYNIITQFLTGGCEISLITAIDFTGSNGDPVMPNSLHYMNPTGKTTGIYTCFSYVDTIHFYKPY